MLKRKYMIIAFLALCLTATLFIGVTSSPATTSTAEYDPWVDINDDGIIDIFDIVTLAVRYGATGTPINKTALLLDLLARVEALEKGGYVGAPAYDSGWVDISQGQVLILTHNLDTTEVLVYVIGNTSIEGPYGIHQIFYGGVRDRYMTYTEGLNWYALTNTTIIITRYYDDWLWDQVRVMMWKVQPVP